MIDLSALAKYKENNRLEVKKAVGGLPKSTWESYSAFANTNGGVILFGVDELPDKTLKVLNLENPEKLVADFWNTIHSKDKVSVNILSERNIRIETVDNKKIIIIEVPRARLQDRPVYLNKDYLNQSFRRNGEGDYHCTKAEVQAMLRDAHSETQDMRVIEKLPLSIFDYESVRRYRNNLEATRPGHVWIALDNNEFLYRLGCIGHNSETGALCPTAAGLLMFGLDYEIVKEYPNYFLDYQEHYEAGGSDVRWTDRFCSSTGEWSGNLYDFFTQIANRITLDVKRPFKLAADGFTRIDDTPVHKALREALANCLVNADYYGERGLVIKKWRNRIELANPGSFRITLEEALFGGISQPRNAVLLKMFNLINVGERAGSGIPSIMAVWEKEGWSRPEYSESFTPERTVLTLPFSSAKVNGVPNGVPKDTKRGEQKNELSPLDIAVLEFIKTSKPSNIEQVMAAVGGKLRTVSRSIAKLKEQNLICKVGSDKTGHWEAVTK